MMMSPDVSQGWGIRDGGRRGPWRVMLVAMLAVLAIVAVFLLMEWRKPPLPAEAEVAASLDPVEGADVRKTPTMVQGWGIVSPKVEVDIMPEVAGKVTFIHSGLKAGGVIRAGEKIVQIDPRDCEMAVRQARAAVAEAQACLDGATAEADVARRDWRRLNPEAEPDSSVVFREAQIHQARAALESAKARLALAELQLERTNLSLPYDVLVAAQEVDLGQYVAVGQPLAKAYGIDAFEVEVPLADEDLAGLDAWEVIFPVNLPARETRRVPADVKMTFAGREYTWQGYVVRAAGRVDRNSGRIPVIVEIPQPLGPSGDKPPLLPGTSVQVLISGGTPEDTAEKTTQ